MPASRPPRKPNEEEPMDNLLTVAFEAHNNEANHHRHYAVTVGRDLLDDWTVAIRYGRIAQAGRALRYAAAEPQALRAILRHQLRRRLSPPERRRWPRLLPPLHARPPLQAPSQLRR